MIPVKLDLRDNQAFLAPQLCFAIPRRVCWVAFSRKRSKAARGTIHGLVGGNPDPGKAIRDVSGLAWLCRDEVSVQHLTEQADHRNGPWQRSGSRLLFSASYFCFRAWRSGCDTASERGLEEQNIGKPGVPL